MGEMSVIDANTNQHEEGGGGSFPASSGLCSRALSVERGDSELILPH